MSCLLSPYNIRRNLNIAAIGAAISASDICHKNIDIFVQNSPSLSRRSSHPSEDGQTAGRHLAENRGNRN
ncbi:MAG TPA: hypothetical protein VKP60_16835, partial [Magnetospirillaceae bacterium]|nr:hypothetical protein [Magnetospirillaceae bacterium]